MYWPKLFHFQKIDSANTLTPEQKLKAFVLMTIGKARPRHDPLGLPFPLSHTVRATFAAYGVPSLSNDTNCQLFSKILNLSPNLST